MITNSQTQTIDFGRKIAKFLKVNSTIALCGDLGAGKTTLVKGIAGGLGVNPKEVNSPSYVLVKEYRAKQITLVHCDLYRLDKLEAVGRLGLEDYLREKCILVIEWAEKGKDFLPDEYLQIDLSHCGENKRKIKIYSHGEKYRKVVEKIKTVTKSTTGKNTKIKV
ncbi:MAG: tRNA (adenosine(37)-N6)-threonylcarbamoyltransferase complex ATPase subunit type 1 TsaE [Candidatus Omnitrophota bacterium]